MLKSLRTDVRRRLTRYLRSAPIAVCECNAWDSFMIQALCPDAVRIPIIPGEPAGRVLNAIPRAARMVVMHIDVSCTDGFLENEPALFDQLGARGVALLNARATDLRKRTLHERCAAAGIQSAVAAREGPPDDRVIIKTTLNAAGVPERRLVARGGRTSSRFRADLSEYITDPHGYVVCKRSEVPETAWQDPTLAVERYIDNPEGIFYRVYALGPATVVAQIWTDLEIKKLLSEARRREYHYFWTVAGEHVPLSETSDDIIRAVSVARGAAAAMQVDFHGTDCVLDTDGTVIPIDVNKTPFWGNVVRPGVLEHIRLGLEYMMGSGGVGL